MTLGERLGGKDTAARTVAEDEAIRRRTTAVARHDDAAKAGQVASTTRIVTIVVMAVGITFKGPSSGP